MFVSLLSACKLAATPPDTSAFPPFDTAAPGAPDVGAPHDAPVTDVPAQPAPADSVAEEVAPATDVYAPPLIVASPQCPAPRDAPRPVRPLHGEVTATRSPRFRWALAAPGTPEDVRVEVCADLRCERVLRAAVSRELEWVPAEPLPVETRSWRVVRVADGAASPTRLVRVSTTEPRPRGRVRIVDFDGDGIADTIGAGPGPWRTLVVHYGNGSTPDTVIGPFADRVTERWDGCRSWLSQLVYAYREVSALSAGDLDGDGFQDLLVVAYNQADSCAYPWLVWGMRVLVVPGAPGGLRLPLLSVDGAEASTEFIDRFPPSLVAGDDFDDDGYEDLLFDARDNQQNCYQPFQGRLLHGAPGICLQTTTSVPSGPFGLMVAGDIDGDGVAEVCARNSIGAASCVSVQGRQRRSVSIPQTCAGASLRFPSPCGTPSPDNISRWSTNPFALTFDDVNDDGLADARAELLSDGTPGAPRRIATYFGGPGGFDSTRCRIDTLN